MLLGCEVGKVVGVAVARGPGTAAKREEVEAAVEKVERDAETTRGGIELEIRERRREAQRELGDAVGNINMVLGAGA